MDGFRKLGLKLALAKSVSHCFGDGALVLVTTLRDERKKKVFCGWAGEEAR